MVMPGRKYEPVSGYRYGFNGKEQDKDLNSLTAYDYGFRIYNPAIGRFLSVDPLTSNYPYYTPYQFAGNMPLWAIDLDGLEDKKSTSISTITITRPAITQLSAAQIKKNQEILALRHVDKKILEGLPTSSSSSGIETKNKFSKLKAYFNEGASGGKISHDQNPILAVSKVETTSSSEIVDLTEFGMGKFIKNEIITKSTVVDVNGPAFSDNLKSIKTTTTTTTVYQKFEEDGKNTLTLYLNEAGGTTSTTTTITNDVIIANNYEEDIKLLPADLATAVREANETNRTISGNALKGINESFKAGEKNADDGKLIPNKGKYYPSDNTPGKKNPYQH